MLHIKLNGITVCSNMVENILPPNTRVQKVKFQLFAHKTLLKHFKNAPLLYPLFRLHFMTPKAYG